MPETKDTPPGLIAQMKARYAEQSAKPDVQKARRLTAIAISVGVILLGGYLIWHRHSRADDTTFTVGVMPTCASTPVRRLLKQAIDEAPGAKQASAVLQRVDDVRLAFSASAHHASTKPVSVTLGFPDIPALLAVAGFVVEVICAG